jgi:hypothetical protein
MNDPQLAAVVHTGNFALTAMTILVHCLKNQGVLGDRQYENALRATIEAEGAERERLADLLPHLEKQQPGQPPKIDAIH